MLGFWIVVIAIGIAGTAAADRLWTALDGPAAGEETMPAERITAGAVVGLALWLAVNWILALTHTLTRATLLGAAAAIVIAAAIIVVKRKPSMPRLPRAWLLAILPIAFWIAYILWRGAILPPDSHDALAYHLPKATFIAQAHGYEYFAAPDSRISKLPSNYELLLADVLLMTGGDEVTEWISAAAYLLFVIAAAAVAQRWWGRGIHIAAVVALTAATPLLLLQSGADKNDLLACWLAVAALLWGARWAVRGGDTAWLLLIVAVIAGIGTKPQQAAIALALCPAIVLRLMRTGIRWKDIAATAALVLVVFTLCGGAAYVFDLAHLHDAAEPLSGSSEQHAPLYGDWNNLWQFPYLLLTEPFARYSLAVWVPWRHQYWYWPKYEHYFSSYGPLFTLAACALPFCVWRYRRNGDEAARRERFVMSITATVAVILILPMVFRPLGFFAGMGRYVAFALPVVYGWTAAPLMVDLERASRFAGARLLALLAIVFAFLAFDVAVNDRFSPWTYALRAARQPTRRVWFEARRAGTNLDRMAGPRDVVAVDGGFDTWLYPAMGAERTRKIEFIAPAPAPVVIPDDAQWVMIDRSWNVLWGNLAFRDFGDFWRYLDKGTPSANDVRVLNALLHDPRFQLVYYNRALNQAVFRRKDPAR